MCVFVALQINVSVGWLLTYQMWKVLFFLLEKTMLINPTEDHSLLSLTKLEWIKMWKNSRLVCYSWSSWRICYDFSFPEHIESQRKTEKNGKKSVINWPHVFFQSRTLSQFLGKCGCSWSHKPIGFRRDEWYRYGLSIVRNVYCSAWFYYLPFIWVDSTQQ